MRVGHIWFKPGKLIGPTTVKWTNSCNWSDQLFIPEFKINNKKKLKLILSIKKSGESILFFLPALVIQSMLT